MNIWVSNRQDDGETVGKTPKQVKKPDRHPSPQLRMPNLWQNWISDDMRVVAAFVPIDAENPRIYFRYYQRVLKAPILRELLLAAAWLMNLRIERQDKRVVEPQLPMGSDLDIGEEDGC